MEIAADATTRTAISEDGRYFSITYARAGKEVATVRLPAAMVDGLIECLRELGDAAKAKNSGGPEADRYRYVQRYRAGIHPLMDAATLDFDFGLPSRVGFVLIPRMVDELAAHLTELSKRLSRKGPSARN